MFNYLTGYVIISVDTFQEVYSMDTNDKLDRIVLLLEHMDKKQDEMQKDINVLKQDVSILKNNLGIVMETVNTINNDLTSKIGIVDKKVNVVAGDILELRAAQ